ncbi:hypothetical protein CHS0354_037239 [Potamilus streckersoni]|uniref:Nascent polypeptide-associated complex subunit alpha-like UBA domain-containing protein n=1 Tax=Potamilus streckersoni TaxID=2493646 RepID=A0AAE0W2K5_9BIVA|nr:hypothetical protein CHS0354_037239 [Potamilus streckersoni]
MATEEEQIDVDDESNEPKGKKAAKHDSGAADLEKVTDYHEEAEISAPQIGEALNVVSTRKKEESTAMQEKEKELSKVKINKEDVDLIVQEMEIPRTQAERKLREHKGNVVEALIALTN